MGCTIAIKRRKTGLPLRVRAAHATRHGEQVRTKLTHESKHLEQSELWLQAERLISITRERRVLIVALITPATARASSHCFEQLTDALKKSPHPSKTFA